jgi:hypothetical protein
LESLLEAVYQQAKAAASAAVKALLEALLEVEVTAKLGREKGAVLHISGQPRTTDWVCCQCGCADAQQFTRDGHYRRGLQTGWAVLRSCGGDTGMSAAWARCDLPFHELGEI